MTRDGRRGYLRSIGIRAAASRGFRRDDSGAKRRAGSEGFFGDVCRGKFQGKERRAMTQEQGEVNEYGPPREFASRAKVTDPAVYEEAARYYEGFWAGWAR